MSDEFRAWAFRMRGGLWTLMFAFMLIIAGRFAPNYPVPGLALVVVGQLWRFWAAGSIGRYRGENLGAEQLVTWGPYSIMRNPLYFGNGLIGLGWGLMAGLWVAVAFIIGFVLMYVVIIIPYEESFLAEKFGDSYEKYRKSTGVFFPASIPGWRLSGPFDAGILWASERHTVLTTVIGTCLMAMRSF